jgi:hypothetical protein
MTMVAAVGVVAGGGLAVGGLGMVLCRLAGEGDEHVVEGGPADFGGGDREAASFECSQCRWE